jgi:8-oxo-dGTP pyrophosphatase MutT (NUDIX family)
MTLRSSNLRNHAGEVCFPGGRPEPGDADLEATARREAVEELGVAVLEVFGRLSSVPLYTSDYRLEPFVAQVDPRVQKIEPAEVAQVLPVGILEVLRGPPIDAIAYSWAGVAYLSPVFVLEGHPMFGATAHTFLELLRVLGPAVGLAVPELVTGRFAWTDFLAG